MTDSNLPPGCRVSDIPGNRPEDEREEAFWDMVYAKAQKLGLGLGAYERNWTDRFEELVRHIRDAAFDEGYNEGRSEGFLDAASSTGHFED